MASDHDPPKSHLARASDLKEPRSLGHSPRMSQRTGRPTSSRASLLRRDITQTILIENDYTQYVIPTIDASTSKLIQCVTLQVQIEP